MEQIIKSRKVHTCSICDGNIQKGEKYMFYSERLPRYDNDDNQKGIEYSKHRSHLRNCIPKSFLLGRSDMKVMWDNCGRGNHKWLKEEIPGDWYNEDGEMNETGRIICEYCGDYKK